LAVAIAKGIVCPWINVDWLPHTTN